MHRLLVAGLGYVGLQLVRRACEVGMSVTGYDIDDGKVAALRSGRSYVDDVSDADVRDALDRGLRLTSDPEHVRTATVVVVCVPTPLRADLVPDLSAVERVMTEVAEHLRPGTLVVLESTVSPGTTEDVVRATLEKSGLTAGHDFALAFSPERIDPGNPRFGLGNTPKVVGGLTPRCRDRVADFYRLLVDEVVLAHGLREAEMAKLLENTYRYVNIALVNEVAAYCDEMGADVWNVVELAASKPFGFQSFRPGPGIGGHCIPVDSYYLSHPARVLGRSMRLVEAAHDINAGMPRYVAERVQRLFNSRGAALRDKAILLLGVTYKADVADDRQSPAAPLTRALRAGGARVSYHDPYIEHWSVDGRDVPRCSLPDDLAAHDAVVLLQEHSAYDPGLLAARSPVLFDTRGVAEGLNVIRL